MMRLPTGLINHNFIVRTVSAIVLAGLLGTVVVLGGFYFSVAVLIIAVISMLEWHCIVNRSLKNNVAWEFVGLLCILPASIALLYLRLRYEPSGLNLILWLFGVVCSTDICAYIVGRSVGGPRLASKISPGKTIAGSLGGLIGACIFGAALATLVSGLPVMRTFILAAALSVLAQVGDLMESAFKRKFGVKDSGFIIPGHGGILDRADSFFLTLPCMFLYAVFYE